MVKFDKVWFNIVSPAVHTLLPSVLQNSCGVEALILILKKSPHLQIYDLIIGPILLPSHKLFSCWGTESSQVVPNQENMEGDQQVQSHNHAQQSLKPQTWVQEHCPGETGLPSSVFQAVFEMSPVLLFKVLNNLSIVALSWKVEFNACQISLLWHNSFL